MQPHPALLRGFAVAAPDRGSDRAFSSDAVRAIGWGSSLRTWAPLIAALGAVGLVSATGLTQRSLYGTPLEDRFFGFFLDRYPLFLFAVVYGVARTLVTALEPPRHWGRIITGPLGVAVFLAFCLHPTFGGLVLRPGYMTGTVAFLNGIPTPLAIAAGSAASALVFGLSLGLAVMLARLRRPVPGWRALGRSAAVILALWLGAVILAMPWALGVPVARGWPAQPLSGEAALLTLAVVALALLPHALLTGRFSSLRSSHQS